MVLKYIQDVL
jgi:hypothetical protein